MVSGSFFDADDLKQLRMELTRPNGDSSTADLTGVYDRALKLGFDSCGALFLLSALGGSQLRSPHPIVDETIQRIEEEYFSGNPQWLDQSSPYSKLCVDSGIIPTGSTLSFRTVVHNLSPQCKALIMGFAPRRQEKVRKSGLTKDEISARWHNLDPVDMETLERDHFLKTGQQLRTRDVKAMIRPMPVGSRLRQVLGLEFLEQMDHMNVDDFMLLASALLTAPANGVFHRDLKTDAQFRMCKKIMGFTLEDVGKNIIPISLILSSFEPTLEIPNRVWNRTVIPAIRKNLCGVSKVPRKYSHLSESSRWALLTATLLSSGRVKTTPRLMSYLKPKFIDSISTIDHTVIDALLDGLIEAGIADSAILTGLSSMEGSVELLGKLVHVRNHFGVFGKDFDELTDRLVEQIKADPSTLANLSPSKRVMVHNSVWASTKELGSQCEIIPDLTAELAANLPDLDIGILGWIDSILE